MSYTEINDEGGLRYGGMPYDQILFKLEETDPELVSEVRGEDFLHDTADDYNQFVRREIIDWSPDAPFMESDHARRDPAWSRSMLNLRYNATRGSSPELPRHPEMFWGFMGDDPRGVLNDPRFDQMRGQISARAAELEARMQNNADQFVAERPWTNQSISYGMKELHRRLRNNTKVFTPQKEGRPYGRNVVVDDLVTGHHRRLQKGDGADGLHDVGPIPPHPAEWMMGEDPSAPPERFFASDYGPAAEATEGGSRRVDRRAGADMAPWRNATPDADMAVQLYTATRRGGGPQQDDGPWRHTTGDADLPVQQYGQSRGRGRTDMAPGATGGARTKNASMDHDTEETLTTDAARGTTRQTLGATMALATKYSKLSRAGSQETDHGSSYETDALGRSAPIQRDVAMVYRSQQEDTDRRPASAVGDDEGGALGGSAGLTPAAHPERAARSITTSHANANPYLANTEAIVRGLREATAGGRRRIAGEVIAAGVRATALAESEREAGRGMAPSSDLSKMTRFIETPVIRTGAAKGLEVATYKSAAPRVSNRMEHGRTGSQFGRHAETKALGKSGKQEFRSHTHDPAVLGDAPASVFGSNSEVAYRGVTGMSTSAVRPREVGEDITARDSMGGMGEVF